MTSIIDYKLSSNLLELDRFTNDLLPTLDLKVEIDVNDTQRELLNKLQTTFEELYVNLNGLRTANKSDKVANGQLINIHQFNAASLLTILDTFKNGSLVDEIRTHNDSLSGPSYDVASQMERIILWYLSLIVYSKVSRLLISNTLPLSSDISYWNGLLDSNLSFGVYCIQILPSKVYGLVCDFANDVKSFETEMTATRVEVPSWVGADFESLYVKVVNFKNLLCNSFGFTLDRLMKFNPGYIFMRLNPAKAAKFRSFNYARVILGTPFYSIAQEIYSKRDALVQLRDENSAKIGLLVSQLPDYKEVIKDDSLAASIPDLLDYVLKQKTLEVREFSAFSDSDKFFKLNQILSTNIPTLKASTKQIIASNRQPGFWTRYWPILTLGLLYGPSASSSVIDNKEKIVEWIRLNLIDTVYGFYKNWVIKPIDNILSTVRHDSNSRVAIVSKQSLNSDLDSLERMVIDYSIDVNGNTMSQLELTALKEEIKLLVANGDLTPLMKSYELDLKSPIKNLVRGNLLRALLIQIQKTKVDGEVAISGIDKLLKSQELLFGFVAAAPSMFVCFYLVKNIQSYLKRGYISINSAPSKTSVAKNLNNIERLLNLQLNGDQDKESYLIEGSLLIEIILLRRNSSKLIPTNRRSEWIRDINDLNDLNFSVQARLNTIQRIWNSYRSYFS